MKLFDKYINFKSFNSLNKYVDETNDVTCHTCYMLLFFLYFRLPLFQGGTVIYIVPLMIISDLDGSFCSSTMGNVLLFIHDVNPRLDDIYPSI